METVAAPDAPAARPAASPERLVYATAAAVFAASAAATLWSIGDMAGGMPMPGGWTMSMMWMRMPGQTWASAGAMFIAMWAAMMVAMMLPSSLPILLVYRRTLAFRGEPGLAFALWSLGAAYFAVWTAFGVVAYLGGLGIAAAAMRSEAVARSVPLATGLALVVAGAYQLTPWKSACLRHCRDPLRLIAAHLGGGRRGAVALGLHHGAFCAGCCSGLMVVQLSLGIMSVAAMIAVAAVIAAEKLLPQGLAIARGAGVAAIAAGFFLAGSSVL